MTDVPRWHPDAACRDRDLAMFFPTSGKAATPALRVCERCPVQPECLEFALSKPEHHGVWGGATERERAAMRRERKRGAA